MICNNFIYIFFYIAQLCMVHVMNKILMSKTLVPSQSYETTWPVFCGYYTYASVIKDCLLQYLHFQYQWFDTDSAMVKFVAIKKAVKKIPKTL